MSLLYEVRAEAFKRPWLAAPIVIGSCLQLLLGGFSAATGVLLIAKTLLGAAATVAVTAVFIELWRGDGRRVETGGLLRTTVLLLMSYPLLLLFGVVSTSLTYALLHADGPPLVFLYLMICAGKLVAFAATALSVLAVARREESAAALQAFGRGWRLMMGNAGFLAGVLIATYLIQEAAVYGVSLAYYSLGTQSGVAIRLLTGILATTIPLIGCVAVPLQALKTGRLKP